ncbi:hypothetical protein [Acinetobacter baumannii]|nr:hypothetical protein [Acinetobacter baumannii]
MKPEQFIKRYGINEAKKIIDKAPNGTTHIHSVTLQNYMQGEGNNYVWCGSGRDGWYFSIYDTLNGMMALEDLKRLVESVDLVELLGGIDIAKRKVKMAEFNGFLLISVPVENGFGDIYAQKVERAIRDHESIYGGGE